LAQVPCCKIAQFANQAMLTFPDGDERVWHALLPATRDEVAPVRIVCGVAAGSALLCALAYALDAAAQRSGWGAALLGSSLLLGLVCLWLGWGAREPRIEPTIRTIGWLGALSAAAAAAALGHGLLSVALGVWPVLIALLVVVGGLRAGLALAAACGVGLAALAWATAQGRIAWPGAAPLAVVVGGHAALLAVGLAFGAGVSHLVQRQLGQLADREQRFRALLDIAADWHWELDENLRFTEVSDNADGVSAVSAAERMGRHPWDLQLGLSDDELDAHRADLEARNAFHNLIVRRTASDGSVRHLAVSGQPRFDRRGRFLGYWGVGRDVTTEVRARQAIAVSETRYRELFTRSPSPLVLHREGRVIDANPAALHLFGYDDLAAMIGVDLLAHYDDRDGSRALAAQCVERLELLSIGESLPPGEFVLRARNGRKAFVRGTGVRVDAQGGPATLSIYLDETERRAAVEAVRHSEALLSLVAAISSDMIMLTELATGRFAMVNDMFCRVMRFQREEVIGRTSLELGLWDDPSDRQRLVESLRDGGRTVGRALRFVRKDGERVSMIASAARLEMDGREYLVLNARDVTEQEQRRLEQEAILHHASLGIAFTRARRFMQANERFAQMFGWCTEQLVGQPDSVVWLSDDEYAQIGHDAGPRLSAGEQVEFERPMRRRDGSTFWCRVLARAADPGHGGTIWITEDVTERRQVEQKLAPSRHEAESASRAKSGLLANISEEIRAPLDGLLELARLAQADALTEAKRRDCVDQIAENAQALADMLNDILDLSKIEAGKLTLETLAFELPATVTAVHRAYQSLAATRGLALQLDLDLAGPSVVVGDPVRLRQILGNFLSNALKFTHEGEIVLRVRALPGDRVRFEVQDTGPGIDDATRERLFHPFTQADPSAARRLGSSGLGLSICRELAQLMGGSVGVLSEPGNGSVFWAELPLPSAGDGIASASRIDAHAEAPALLGAHALVVEDNPVNLMICVALLEQQGLRVEQADSGPRALDAVERARAAGDPFDVVLMDVQMPGMSGHEATRRLRERYDATELPIIALTAAALVSEREQAFDAGMNDFLTKPIEPAQMLRALSRAMDHAV
jgi:PAS domain S-box-containing protein